MVRYREANEAVARAVATYPDRLVGAIRLNPLFGEEFVWETVRYFVEERGLGGIKLVARADFYNPASLRVIGPVFEAAAQYDIPILFHSGHPSRDLPSLQGYAARQYPQLKVIIAHIGLHDYLTETILVCKEAPNVFADMSQAWPYDIKAFVRAVGEVERVYFGGCAPNVAVGAARLGARAALVSVVGDDFRTRGYSAWLDERGVDQRAVQLIAGERCGDSFLFRDAGGNSVCISQLGVAARQEEFTPDAATTAAGKVAVITCRFDRFTLRAAELARAGGARVILSGALATAPALAAAFIATSDILVCTEHELTQLVSLLVCDERVRYWRWGYQQ